MGSIDGLREQVEELKQRLNDPGSQKASEPGELKTRLASIKASLESKQGEIAQLSVEKKQLAAEKEKLSAEKERLAAKNQHLTAENDQLRNLLKDVISVIDGQSGDASTDILREFLAETDPLIKPNGDGSETVIAAGPPLDLKATGAAKAESVAAGAQKQAADRKNATQQGPDSGGVEADEEESPALRRIMKRGRRAAG